MVDGVFLSYTYFYFVIPEQRIIYGEEERKELENVPISLGNLLATMNNLGSETINVCEIYDMCPENFGIMREYMPQITNTILYDEFTQIVKLNLFERKMVIQPL